MKPASSKQKSAHHSKHAPDQDSAAGPNGLAIAPPTYGIDAIDNQVIQVKPEPAQTAENRTGLPDKLKAGVETLSGLAMDDVRVHFNSRQPAQLQALAYTQGTDIHVGPGQEKHLPHEAWHVVQQKQGRVRPTLQMNGGLSINDNSTLEREADIMGEHALEAGAIEQTSAPPVDSPLTNMSVPPIQGVWRYFDGMGSNKFVFWSDEGDGAEPNSPVPSVWAKYKVLPKPDPGHFYLVSDMQRPLRGRMPALTLEQWTAQYGGSQRKPSDVYNPYGRLDARATAVSFMPSAELPPERSRVLLERLEQSDKAFQRINIDFTRKLLTYVEKENQGKSVRNSAGYPVIIVTDAKKVLSFVNNTEFGATYSDVRPENIYALPKPNQIDDPAALHWAKDVKPSPEFKRAQNSGITKEVLESWHGKERELQQGQVMGMSAADAAANAGFNRDEGLGWEWLHLIAHSMGGIQVVGPQVAENLVAGTSECNTQMIIVEEFLKDIIRKTEGRARLHVQASMYDPQRHIGDRITYDFVIYDKLDKPIVVYHWAFECLSRRNPLVAQNRELRYAGREVFGIGDKEGGSKGYSFGKPSPFGPVSSSSEPNEGARLSEGEMRAAISSIPESRRSQIAVMLGRDASENTPEHIFVLLSGQPYKVVLDIVRGSSNVKPGDGQIQLNVDAQLAEYRMRRRRSDMLGFICLIDSIHQLLAGAGIEVNRDKLIQEVHRQTGRHMGDMLEIIGDEGTAVLRAVDNVVFATHARHMPLLVHVYMVMPDGTIVPFYRANRYIIARGGDEIDLNLLFVNNNHYEPLFDY
jgi:hypothetical protein